ncbi:MAG: DeoR/GlpR family DNA-binding transcription regulator [Clostridium sp.]|nr:DeoR/GlpR family DNA-binding transcription regulator [Clostridium sp.]
MEKGRLIQLEEYVKAHQKVPLDDLCRTFGISMSTLRRDINTLAERGCVQKAYGYVFFNYSASRMIPFHIRSTINTGLKKEACRAAASLICDNDTIFIDSGSTTCHLMDYLADRKNLTVITGNLDVILRAAPMENIHLLVCAGELNRKNNSFSPVMGMDSLDRMNFSKAFLAASGLTTGGGFSHSYLSERPLKQTVLEKSAKHYFVVDSSKFGVKALLSMCPINRADAICTDSAPEEAYIEYCSEHGIPLVYPPQNT